MKASLGTALYTKLRGDRSIWLIVAMLTVLSLLAVYSATGSMAFQEREGNTEFYLIKQLLLVSFGLFSMYICYLIHYTRFSILAPLLLVLSIFLLILTYLVGPEINNARRWLIMPVLGISFQTSDLAKVALIVYVARSIAKKQDNIKDFNSAFLPIIAPILLVCGLIAPSDLSTSILLFITCLLMMFVGRIQLKYIAFLIMMGMFVFALLIIIGTWVLPDYVRVDTWISRLVDFYGGGADGYQITASKIAIANGEWFGVGPGYSVQRNFLPYAYADFIYAIICEEYGLVGGLAIIGLYIWLLIRVTIIVTRSPKTFGALLAMGLCLSLVIQALAHIAISVNLLPETGLNLPMVSFGGTSLIFTCITIGMILSVSKYIEQYNLKAAKVKRK